MSETDDDRAELLRRFEEVITTGGILDLRQLGFGPEPVGQLTAPRRPELRQPRLKDPRVYRVRVDLQDAQPPIWRRLDLRSDLPLDVVHKVIQAAFDWLDCHLHRFSIGGHPFDQTSQIFLCPFDADEAEDDDRGGVPEVDVRLDEVLHAPGDVLRYLYDYGDSWELLIRLEEVRLPTPQMPSVRAVDGRRAAPPEDSGGTTDAARLAEVLKEPARFNLDEVNRAVSRPYFRLIDAGLNKLLCDLVYELQASPVGTGLARRALALGEDCTEPDLEEIQSVLTAHRWFLDRAVGDGIPLTKAGYLKPADVEAAARVVPTMASWPGRHNRENLAHPLLSFRKSLQSMGLLRKSKGALRLTRSGVAAQRDPQKLWHHLAARLVPATPNDFDMVASQFVLVYAASSPGATLALDEISEALAELGWRHADGSPLRGLEVLGLDVSQTLRNITDRPADLGSTWIHPLAAALSRAALRRT